MRGQLTQQGASERLRAIADTAPVIFWLGDPELACTFLSPAWTEFTGRPVDEGLGRGFVDAIHPDDAGEVWEAFRAAFRDMEPFELDFRLQAADGSYRWVADRGAPFFENGEFVGFLGTCTDVDDRVRALENSRFLAEAAEFLDGSLDLDETVGRLARISTDRICDWCSIVLLDDEGRPYEAEVHHHDAEKRELARAIRRDYPPEIDEDVGTGQVIRSGEPLLIERIDDEFLRSASKDERMLEMLRELGMVSAVVAPLTARGQTFGAIHFVSGDLGRVYGPADAEFASELARRAALALDNSRLYDIAETERRAVTRQRDLYERLLEAQAEVGEGFVLVEGERIVYVNEASERIARRSAEELYAIPSFFEIVAPDEHAHVAERVARIYANEQVEPGFETALVGPDGDRIPIEVAAKPLRIGDLLQLVVVVRDITDRHEIERRRAELLASERQARREAEVQQRRTQLLSEIGAELQTSLHIDQSLQTVARLIVEELADVCTIDLVRPDGSLRRLGPGGRDEEERERVRSVQRAGQLTVRSPHIISQAIRESRTIVLEDVTEEDLVRMTGGDPDYLEALRELDLAAMAAIPLRASGRILGALVLGWHPPRSKIDPDDLRLAETASGRIALAADNSRLYEEREHIARTLQSSLLPPTLPEVPGLWVAARYSAGSERLEVGGDFYDLFQTGPRTWTLVVGDVCGKGAEAAAMTALARYSLRALAIGRTDPGDLLSHLNDAIARQRHDFRFVTAVVARLVVGEEGIVLDVGAAGHPPPLLLRADGERKTVDAGGPALGIHPLGVYPTQSVNLGEGDLLVFFTDGLTDARRDPPIEPEELFEVIATARASGPSAVAAALEGFADSEARGARRDDVAMLVLEVPDPEDR